jgi:hypothetical protein
MTACFILIGRLNRIIQRGSLRVLSRWNMGCARDHYKALEQINRALVVMGGCFGVSPRCSRITRIALSPFAMRRISASESKLNVDPGDRLFQRLPIVSMPLDQLAHLLGCDPVLLGKLLHFIIIPSVYLAPITTADLGFVVRNIPLHHA